MAAFHPFIHLHGVHMPQISGETQSQSDCRQKQKELKIRVIAARGSQNLPGVANEGGDGLGGGSLTATAQQHTTVGGTDIHKHINTYLRIYTNTATAQQHTQQCAIRTRLYYCTTRTIRAL
jgi:hypothetical protein